MNFKKETMRLLKTTVFSMTLIFSSILSAHELTDSVAKPAQWTLSSCINYALKQNITIRKSQNTLQQSLVDTKTYQAALFPSLNAYTSQDVTNQPFGGNGSYGSSYNSGNKTTYNGSYGLNASWTVYNGGKNKMNIQYEQLQNKINELGIAYSQNDIQISITKAYLQILYAAEAIKINENTVVTSKATLDRSKELYTAGKLAKPDVAQLESQYSQDKYTLVSSQVTLSNYRLQLKQLLEIEGSDELNIAIPQLVDDDVLTPLPAKEEIYQEALGIMPEIKSSKLNTDASKLNEKIAKTGSSPTVSISGQMYTGHNSVTTDGLFTQLKNGWNNTIGVSVSVPIFDNRSTKSAVEKARLTTESSQLNELDKRKTLYQTIESIWQDANSYQIQYTAAKEKVKSAQTSFDLVTEQFKLGMKNTLELLTQKNNLLSAEQSELQAKYMSILNVQLLKFYEGQKITLN